MEIIQKIKQLLDLYYSDAERFYNKNNKSAGTRARKTAQELKTLFQESRLHIISSKKTEV
ncbi:MAG: histone H1 [Chitinophagaceae bacterium]|jgi:hypothetical protein|nr:histone H1 [Chitinophagaceae bacterium]